MRPTREGSRARGLVTSGFGFSPEQPVGEVPPPTDYLQDENAHAWYPVSGSADTSLIQSKTPTFTGGAALSQDLSYDSAVTGGSLLVVVLVARSDAGGSFAGPGDWEQLPSILANGSNGGSGAVFYKIADGTEGTGPFTFITAASGVERRVHMAEFAGPNIFIQQAQTDNHAATTSYAIGSVTPTASTKTTLLAVALNSAAITSIGTGYTTVSNGYVGAGSNGPASILTYKAVDPASGSYDATVTQSSNDLCAGDHIAFSGTADPEWIPAPLTIDDDDATYHEVIGHDECWRAQLVDTYQVGRARLVIGCDTSGSKTYDLEGQTLADIGAGTGTVIGSFTFTATGSFTADTIEITTPDADGYEFYRLVGPAEDRRIFTVEMYPPTAGEGVTDHGALTGLADDDHPQYVEWDELGWFNVMDYGATGDGTTDDRASIQDALDACFAAGGGTVFFPIGTYYVGDTLQDTGTYNSLLKIPQTTGTGYGLRFLGERSTIMTDWAGTITGTPSVISAGLHDSHTLNEVFLRFERIRIQVPQDPKLSGIDATKAITVRWNDLLIYTGSTPTAVPTNTNAIGLDMPWGFNDQNSGGEGGLYVIGFYTGVRPSEQTVATAMYISHAAVAAEFRGSPGPPDYLAHMVSILRFNAWFCVRALVFTGDRRSVYIPVLDTEHNDPDFETVYDIDDASNYGRGFIGVHISDYDTGDTADDLLINGGTGLSIFIDHEKRWRFANVVDIPIGTNPATNPGNGRRLYTDSSDGHLSARDSSGNVIDYETDISGVTVSGTPSADQVLTATSSSAASWQDASGGSGIGEILISDTPSTPLVFADLIQNEAQNDLVYADP